MEYMTSAEFAEKWDILQRRQIEGAVLKGCMLMIPADAKSRKILGKYEI